MNRHLHEPFTMPDHPELLHKINETSIAIKLHYLKPDNVESEENWQKARASTQQPTWENIVELLRECHQVINEKRHNLIKY